MENRLEQLLNSFIKRWRVPFGEKCKTYEWIFLSKSTRDLASKESWLWQFVCENRKHWYTMPQWWIKNPKIYNEWIESVEKECNQNSYEYYIIESALKDDSELEDFLLSNIVIKDEK